MLPSCFSRTSQTPKECRMTFYPSSCLRKTIQVAAFLLLGASIASIGTMSYFRLTHSDFVYGAISLGGVSLLSMIMNSIETTRTRATTSEHKATVEKKEKISFKEQWFGKPLSPDILYIQGTDIERPEVAIQRLKYTEFQKIVILCFKGTESTLFFQPGDGKLRDFDFEQYDEGKVLLIYTSLTEETDAYMETCPNFIENKFLHGGESGTKGKLFLDKKHKHVHMTYTECNAFLSNQKFPGRIAKIITSKT